MNKEQLANHPTFTRDLARALVLGQDSNGSVTPERWNQAAGCRGSLYRGMLFKMQRLFSGQARKTGLKPEEARNYLIFKFHELDEGHRKNLWRYFFCRTSYEAWGEFFGKTPVWARRQLSKSLDALRKGLDCDFGQDRSKWCQGLSPLADWDDPGGARN